MVSAQAARSTVKVSEYARAVGAQLRADAFALEHCLVNTYDRRPEKRCEARLQLDEIDTLEARRWRALMEEFSPTWVERLGAWPNGHIQG